MCRVTTIQVGPASPCNCGKFRGKITLFERLTQTPYDLAQAVVYFDGWNWRSVLLHRERFKERSEAVGATVIALEGTNGSN
jgi:hypothetical protein